MPALELFSTNIYRPFVAWGLTHPFWSINVDTVIHTWIVMAIIGIIIIGCRIALLYPKSIPCYLVTQYVLAWRDLYQQTVGSFSFAPFAFVISLFTYIMLSNMSALIPGVEEPTSDLNTTLALGISAFIYTQAVSIRAHGILNYFKHFFEPIPLLMPLTLVGEIASIISISFRLFGNIFGGVVITKLLHSAVSGSIILQLLNIAVGLQLIMTFFFVMFEGVIQAFVFTMLTLTSLSLALQTDDKG